MTGLWWGWGPERCRDRGTGHPHTGWAAIHHQFRGILIDTRDRYSLTCPQVALWTMMVVSLPVGVLVASPTVAGVCPSRSSIPDTVLAALGVSLVSGVGSITNKAYKNRTRWDPRARVAQIAMVEEGPSADETVDVTKIPEAAVHGVPDRWIRGDHRAHIPRIRVATTCPEPGRHHDSARTLRVRHLVADQPRRVSRRQTVDPRQTSNNDLWNGVGGHEHASIQLDATRRSLRTARALTLQPQDVT